MEKVVRWCIYVTLHVKRAFHSTFHNPSCWQHYILFIPSSADRKSRHGAKTSTEWDVGLLSESDQMNMVFIFCFWQKIRKLIINTIIVLLCCTSQPIRTAVVKCYTEMIIPFSSASGLMGFKNPHISLHSESSRSQTNTGRIPWTDGDLSEPCPSSSGCRHACEKQLKSKVI